MARRSGSVWTGCGTVFMKEFADHLGSGRMRVLEWLVLLTGIGAVYTAIQDLKTTTSQDPFLFLRLFTDAHDPLPSFMAVLGFLIPLVAIGLGFDAINGEFNRRTMSRILAQPVYRDALLLGKFFAGVATLGVALVTLWLLIIGLGLLTLGVPPTGEEVIRGIGFLFVSLAYGGLMARRRDALLGDLPRRRDLGAGLARHLAADERALAAALAIHHQRDLPDDAAQSHHGPELPAAHPAADASRGSRRTRSMPNRSSASCIPRPARSARSSWSSCKAR